MYLLFDILQLALHFELVCTALFPKEVHVISYLYRINQDFINNLEYEWFEELGTYLRVPASFNRSFGMHDFRTLPVALVCCLVKYLLVAIQMLLLVVTLVRITPGLAFTALKHVA
jgi:hypothetical protein